MSENKQTTDNELLLQIVGYNKDAFEQLYNRYSATIYSFIKEIITNPKLAEKIMLNVFSVFLKRIEHYSTTNNNVFTYLTLLTRNIALDALKRMKFVEDIPIYSDEYEIDFILPNLSLEINSINLDDRIVLAETIKSCKNHLTEVQNLVLSLVYFEGLNEEEIAKRLNVPATTVRQRIMVIMENLHQQYTKKDAENTKNIEVLNLIKLEALGCLSYEEKMSINQLKENDPDFPWKALGEYQNLTALLSTSVSVKPPLQDLKSEIRNIFENIIKGSEVDYPIVASEIQNTEQIAKQVVKPISESIPEPVPESIPEPIPDKTVMPEIKEKQETEFQMKFRDPDPKALKLLKKMETAQTDLKPSPVFVKTEKKVQFKDYNEAVKKPNVIVNKALSEFSNKEDRQAVVKKDEATQNKVSPSNIKKPEVQIKNTDPSIVIEDTRPIVVKDVAATKNRLIPNSSINLKDFLKKEESIPAFKINDKTNVKDEKIIDSKTDAPGIPKPDIKANTSEPQKEIKTINPFIDNIRGNLQNKSAAAIPGQSEIKIKTNETPKEILRSNPFVETEVKLPQSKSIEPVAEKPDINIRKNEPPKEIKSENPFVGKDIKLSESGPDLPEVEKSKIVIKTNQPPKEILSNNPSVEKDVKSPDSKSTALFVKKPDIEIKESRPPKDVKESNTIIEKDVKATESKPAVPIVNNSEIKLKTTEPIKTKNEKISEEVKKEKPFQNVKPAVDKTSFKIRETSFVESDKKPVVIKPVDNTPVPANTDAKTVADEPIDVNKVKESINIDEVLTKLDETNSETLLEDANYDAKVQKIRRKSRRNILVAAAALFAVIIVSAIFIFQKPQNTPVKVSSDIKTTEKPVVSEQINVAPQKDSVAVTPVVDISKPVENTTTELKKTEPKISLPPLPETLSKEESTYFALNEKSDLLNNTIKVNNQTAAAKTENIVPPKEEKIVEEEPAFFVAVEEMPELIGGIQGLQSRITYPKIAEQTNTEGKVLVQAVVNENGKVISANVIKGIGAGCDEVATDAVMNSQFKPGKQRGKNVKVQVTIPIVFKK